MTIPDTIKYASQATEVWIKRMVEREETNLSDYSRELKEIKGRAKRWSDIQITGFLSKLIP